MLTKNFVLQANVDKLIAVYRHHFPYTTIINANPTLRIYWSGVAILEAGLVNSLSGSF